MPETIIINVSGISAPLIVNNVNIYFSNNQDFSNLTTIGLVTLDSVSFSEITITATQEQANAIVDASVVYANPMANTYFEDFNPDNLFTVEISVVSNKSSSEVSLENLGI